MIDVNEIVELEIDSIAFEGKAIAKLNGYVVFVSGGVPGDLVKAKIFKRKRDYAEAKVVEIVRPSESRVKPRCRYFGLCGGCKWQHLDYEEQIRFKRQHAMDAFERIGGLKIDVAKTDSADEFYEYRNKLEMTFSERPFKILENDQTQVALGFHSPGRYDKTIDIEHCYLADESVNSIIKWFRSSIAPDAKLRRELGLSIYDSEKHLGLLRFLTIRKSFATGELMVSLTVLKEDGAIGKLAAQLHESLTFVTTFVSIVNATRAQIASGNIGDIYFGNGYITDKIGKYSFRISPLSFFQTNTRQAEKLYEVIARNFGSRQKVIFDLYSGTGSISLYLSELAEEIYGFELVESAVKDANENADLNGVKNVKFTQIDLLDLFKSWIPSPQNRIPSGHRGGKDVPENLSSRGIPMPDVIILDPPRSGLHPRIAANIHLLGAEKIIYVSCNPTTQARDVKEIVSHGYAATNCQPVDMFPQTYHIENVLTLKKI